jgi:hypothetical protein
MSSVARHQLIATLCVYTLSNVVLLHSGAWSGTLDVTCDDKFMRLTSARWGPSQAF